VTQGDTGGGEVTEQRLGPLEAILVVLESLLLLRGPDQLEALAGQLAEGVGRVGQDETLVPGLLLPLLRFPYPVVEEFLGTVESFLDGAELVVAFDGVGDVPVTPDVGLGLASPDVAPCASGVLA
jgi:hypothetical protein